MDRAWITAAAPPGEQRPADPLIGMWVASASPLRRRDLRRIGPRLAADRQRARAQRSAFDPAAAAGGRRLPGHAGRAPADRRPGADQAAARRRAPNPARSRWSSRREQARELVARHALPAGRHSGASAPRWPGRPAGTASRAISPTPTTRSACCCRSSPQAGLDALDEICAVDGVDGVFIGPADLAASLGHLGQPDHPEVVAAVEQAIATIVAVGQGGRRQRVRRERWPGATWARRAVHPGRRRRHAAGARQRGSREALRATTVADRPQSNGYEKRRQCIEQIAMQIGAERRTGQRPRSTRSIPTPGRPGPTVPEATERPMSTTRWPPRGPRFDGPVGHDVRPRARRADAPAR